MNIQEFKMLVDEFDELSTSFTEVKEELDELYFQEKRDIRPELAVLLRIKIDRLDEEMSNYYRKLDIYYKKQKQVFELLQNIWDEIEHLDYPDELRYDFLDYLKKQLKHILKTEK